MAKVKIGDKITVLSGFGLGNYTPRKHYEVSAADDDGDFSAKDDDGNTWYFNVLGEGREWNRVKPKAKEVKLDEVPSTKTGADEIIGQDSNKSALELAITNDLPVLLVGETGTGKTTLVREQAIKNGKVLTRFSITGETTVDEFVGKYELESGKTVWKDGVLLDAMKTGKWLVADEINVALPEILFVLHSLLDDDKSVTVSNHHGEVVKPHADFRFFATMNPPEEYAGTKELNKAFQSRFSIVLNVGYAEPAIEVKVVADKAGVSNADATKMVDVANALRKAKADDKIFFTCSTRDLLHWGQLIKYGMTPADAFKVSILNKAGIEAEAIGEIYSHILNEYIKLDTPEVELSLDFFKRERQSIIDERKAFEDSKDTIREEITKEIVNKLTAPTPTITTVSKESPKETTATSGVTDDIFTGLY